MREVSLIFFPRLCFICGLVHLFPPSAGQKYTNGCMVSLCVIITRSTQELQIRDVIGAAPRSWLDMVNSAGYLSKENATHIAYITITFS
jgi:hypothetical protein